MSTSAKSVSTADSVRATVAPAAESTPAIKLWATVGVGFTALQAYVLIRWVTGPYFKRVRPGPDELPGWMKTTINVYTVLGLIAMGTVVYFFLVRPRRRDGRVSRDGLLVLVWFQIYWLLDPAFDYFGHMFTFNSYAFNLGSWVPYLPGWIAPEHPGAMLTEPFLWVAPVYVYVCFGGTVVMGKLMRAAQARWSLNPVGTIVVCWVVAFVAITVIEAVWMRVGLYVWPGAPDGITLFHGKYYQYPLNESFFWGSAWTAMAALRYFTNDRGETLAERGSSKLRVTGGRSTLVRYFALLGIGMTTYLVVYTVPQAGYFSSHQSAWPQDIQKRSYFTNNACGPRTDMACPGPAVPIPRPHSAHLDPSGNVVRP
jgi:hypothetical protein